MKKTFLLYAIAAIASFAFMNQNAQAQESDFRFGVNAEGSLPIGNFSDGYKVGYGGNVAGEYFVSPNLAPTLQVGYLNFSGKKISGVRIPSLGAVTLRGGVKYYIPESPIFAQGLVGAAFMNHSAGTAFVFTPGVGVKFDNLEVAAKYEGWSKNGTSSQIGLTVGYYF